MGLRVSVKELVELAQQNNVDVAFLSRSVRESKSLEATNINKQGLKAQVEYLAQVLDRDYLEGMLGP